jgi:UPF0271 protein
MPVAINIDLGEFPDEPHELYGFATVANLACGGHAGDADSMRHAVEAALRSGARIAAHPSYPDRSGFGRVRMTMPPSELRASIASQCRALAEIVARLGASISAVKPHGALYHAARAEDVAEALLEGVNDALGRVPIVGEPFGALEREALRAGFAYLREGFADRGYRDGSLVPRGEAGALIQDPKAAAAQAVELAVRGDVQTVCVHGDTPRAVAIAEAVFEALRARGLLDERR